MSSRHLLGLCLALLVNLSCAWSAHAQATDATSAELSNLIRRAKNNPLAKAAHARTENAIAVEDEAAGNRWTRLEATSFLAPSPRVRCDNADCTQTSPRNVSINIAGLFAGINVGLTQPLYTGGKIHYARKAAKAASGANAALEDEIAGRVAVLVAEAYYGYLTAQELLWMLEDGAEQIENGRKTLEQKLEEGSAEATVQDRFRIQTLQSEVNARIADAVHAKSVALASLQALVGDTTLTLKGGFLEALAFDLEAQSSAPVVDARLRAAQHGVAAYRALETMEKRQSAPDFALSGGFNAARAQGVDDPPGAFANDPFNTSGAYVALTARWNFAPMIQRAKVRQQGAKKREAMANAEAASRISTLDRSNALARATLAQNRLIALKDGERAGKAWVASVVQADAIGAATAKDLADAYLAHFTSRAQLLESTYQWNLAVFELRRQTGEFATHP